MHLRILLGLVAVAAPLAAQPFQTLSQPATAEIAAHFAAPPAAYSSQVTWGWSGVMSREVIARDLDHLLALNIHQAWVEPGRNPEAPYLSPAYFENVKIAVAEAKQRGMHLWFDDDGGYPSGFAGGKFTQEHPELRMKALAAPEQVEVAPGATFTRKLDAQTICAVALDLETGATKLLPSPNQEVNWTAPASGRWAVSLPRWAFRSGPTRSANNSSGAKDTEHSLMDYLSPEANRWFITWTFEQYEKAVGGEFGKTFLGFRGDEAAFGFNPWTPDFPAEFQKRKGYDLRPYLPAVAAIQIGRSRDNAPATPASLDAAHRAYADYCDVWSDLFGENFFAADGAWCASHQLALQTHIEHEEILPQLAIADGDYFKCMRGVQVPGIDVIWHQMWHDVVADFPKLASSAAHLNGHPQAMSETFAAMGGNYPTPNLEEAGWILHHQVVLGITHFEYMFLPASAPRGNRSPVNRPRPSAASDPAALPRGAAPAGYRYLNDPKFPELALEINRATYVLAQGRPAAQVAVYLPSSSFWFGDTAANRSFLEIVHGLLQHQRDLDYVDDASLARSMTVKPGELVNRSGQAYRAVVVPPAAAITKRALQTLQAFAAAGGRVIFPGGLPQLVADDNFLTAQAPDRLAWATVLPKAEVNDALLAELPPADVQFPQAIPGLAYNHRRWRNADVYYFFNEGDTPLTLSPRLTVGGRPGKIQEWNTATGAIAGVPNAVAGPDFAAVPLTLAPWSTKLLVIEHR